MEVIQSFTIDHTQLKPGIYVSRVDKGFTTFDLRITEPNKEPAVAPAAIHSIEHLMATWFRNSRAKEDVVYVGPMGCLTGMYIIMTGSYTVEDMRQLESSIKVRLVTGEGKPFKDFTIMQPDGKAVSLSDFAGKGKYILLDFWASWCGPCKREIPAIKAAYDKFHGPDFDIVSVAVWEQSVSASIDTAKVYGIQWNHILDAKEVPTKLYGVDGIPHLILIGPDGTILKRGLRGEEISAEIGKYIAPVK